MIILYTISAFVVSLIFTALLMPHLIRFCELKKLYDKPNERKIHHDTIPRLGGVLFMPAMLVGMIVAFLLMMFTSETLPTLQTSSFILIAGVFLIYIIGLFDDVVGVTAKHKFIVQIIAACFFPICGLYLNNLYGFLGIYEIPAYISYPLTVFLVLVIVNAVNLIDGIDGLASGLSIMIMCVFVFLYFQGVPTSYAFMASSLMGSIIAFFYFNVYGNVNKGTKIFMGDTGSLILGYAIAYLALKYSMDNRAIFPYRADALLWPYTVLIIPTFDVARVTFGRIRRHVPIFRPDKTHVHHIVMNAGFTMHQTLCIILSLFVYFCLVNTILYDLCESYTIIVLTDVFSYWGFFAMLHLIVRDTEKAVRQQNEV